MRPLFILYFISCATFLTGCVVEENLNVSPHEFADIVKNNPDIQIIDVRTPQEWKEGKVTSAKCIDYFDPDILEKIESLDRDKPVLLYCATGGRSSEIAELLKEYGFKKIYNLRGGYKDLLKEGLH
ncbi:MULTISPECIES: rhodanese-like domain-containing protein [Flectobacillus]|jgi:rhodanese-related sulfurtransferase|uniref:Rhodanese-like domain-containing protein n=1 Tax=Flectobacillus roseus TaxID=502259 RepID=A0ABT6YC21_9BACT|nr:MULTISPECIES: rhodanese-like domain-containing protein [Flectobacillus]MDI9861137.1 rhodanese-like domain-containing protein [Flectobacillus roseus]MDI9872384.1 rhodanese-like domain-containing protein [Flectobacillus roseus]NBA76767.1 rhodanese-like domain-containing protein [Emticicia sp. ODNR4P]PAC32154.1 sulfurtransferase [Flectobacillus sp. BAB-3569]